MSEVHDNDKSHYFFIASIFLVLLIPWGYYDEAIYRYTFVYKKIALIILGLSLLVSVYFNQTIKFLIAPASLGILAFGSSYLLYGNVEKHFILQFIYLEIARQIFLLPLDVKIFLRRFNPLILYSMVFKGFFWSNGNYIHGGYFSSNLFSFLLFLFCLPEIKAKRYYNLLIPSYYLLVSGSKSVYLGIVLIILYSILRLVGESFNWSTHLSFIRKLNIFHYMCLAFLFAFCTSLSLKTGLLYPQVYSQLNSQRKEITTKNMQRRGLLPSAVEDLKSDYESKQKALLHEFPVSPYQTTLVLRAIQYSTFFEFKNFLKVSIIGDFKYILERAFGFNPHNAILDIFARLGVLFCLLQAFFYRETFYRINNVLFCWGVFPALCLQPYGFTLGHGLVFAALSAFILSDEVV